VSEKRSRRSVALELLVWFLISVITAVVLVLLSDSVLPANF
jgi:hypothetical protein